MPISIYGQANPDHARFNIPEDATIWRYMDVGKYLDLITKKKLWFTRAVEFRKTDPYEGGLTVDDERKVAAVLEADSKESLKEALLRCDETNIANMMELNPDKTFRYFQLIYMSKLPFVDMNARVNSISCWHENPTESDAMWALYARRDAGIAIKSNVRRMLKAFDATTRTIYVAKVAYDSDDALSALTPGICDSLLIKRHAFRHENEVRIIALTTDGYESPGWRPDHQVYSIESSRHVSPGVYIECDIFELIEEVVISPLMAQYCYEALTDVTQTLMPNTPIRISKLLTKNAMPWALSEELKQIWSEYNRTGFLRDIGDISATTTT